MIKIGTDVVEISRIAEMENLSAFIRRVFTKRESQYFESKKTPYESIAGCYAAKEAFSKYMGTGMRGFGFKDIEILHDSLGSPYLLFQGKKLPVDVSITHESSVAIAVVCGEEHTMGGAWSEYIKTYQAYLPKTWEDMHKGDCGRLFIVAGSKGMTGAAALCATAALRSGSGLVTVATADTEQPILAAKLTEAMTMALPAKEGCIAASAKESIVLRAAASDACVLGPGLGKGEDLWQTVAAVMALEKPLLIDADGLNALKGHTDLFEKPHGDVVLTPHAGELSRLTGLSIEEIQKDREKVAVTFSQKWGVTLLLKGKNTVIASPKGGVHINPTGNCGMASGGMGDVLSGVIGALLARGKKGYDAAVLGAFLHGLAGDLAAQDIGVFSMLASDVNDRLHRAFQALEQG